MCGFFWTLYSVYIDWNVSIWMTNTQLPIHVYIIALKSKHLNTYDQLKTSNDIKVTHVCSSFSFINFSSIFMQITACFKLKFLSFCCCFKNAVCKSSKSSNKLKISATSQIEAVGLCRHSNGSQVAYWKRCMNLH